MIIFGDVLCQSCNRETRFLHQEGEEFPFLLLGNNLENAVSKKSIVVRDCSCDFCGVIFTVHIMIAGQQIAAFYNDEQFEKFEKEQSTLQQLGQDAGLREEKERARKQIPTLLTIPFDNQPFKKGAQVEVEGQKWKVEQIFKKENIEEDTSFRMLNRPYGEYWYVLSATHTKDTKWMVIADMEQENVTISNDKPLLLSGETYFDVTETLQQDQVLSEEDLDEFFKVKCVEMIAGFRLLLIDKENDDIVLDVFSPIKEEAVEKLEKELAV